MIYKDFDDFFEHSGIKETDSYRFLAEKLAKGELDALKTIVRTTWGLVYESAYQKGRIDGSNHAKKFFSGMEKMIDELTDKFGT